MDVSLNRLYYILETSADYFKGIATCGAIGFEQLKAAVKTGELVNFPRHSTPFRIQRFAAEERSPGFYLIRLTLIPK